MTITVTPLAISTLALLAEQDMHPYEMYQLLIQRGEDRLVKVRPGSLYHTVNRLEAHNLVRVTGTEREGNRPERTTYEITEEGKDILSTQVTTMLATLVNEYPEFPLAISEAHNLSGTVVITMLRQRLVSLTEEIVGFDTILESVLRQGTQRKYWVNLTYQKAVLQAEIAWITTFIAELESGDIDW